MNEAIQASKDKSLQVATSQHDYSQAIQTLDLSLKQVTNYKDNSHVLDNINRTLHFLKSISLADNLPESSNELGRTIYCSDEVVELQSVFIDVFERFTAFAESKSIDFYFICGSEQLKIDRIDLVRMLDNLLTNAIRYTDSGRVFFGVRRRHLCIELQVVDTG